MPSTRESFAALGRAIAEGDEDAVAALLAKGIDIEYPGLVCPDEKFVSPLMFAARHEQAGCASLLLRAGAEPDRAFGSSADTALLMAVGKGDADTATRLLDAGADIEKGDAHGRSPLYVSCMMSHPSCTELLVNARADVEQAMTSLNPGATPLYGAAIGNRCECCAIWCVRLLCEAGAVVDARTEQGATPMMVACQRGNHLIAMMLSSYGASRHKARFEGDMPKTWWARDLAAELGHDELVEWLDASDDFTPLHHVEVLLPSRTLALLRAGACSPVAGLPSPALRAKNYLVKHPDDEAAKMILRASESWSPSTHSLWSEAHRGRVLDLLVIGYQLRSKLAHGSLLDWWIAHVMPHAVAWDVEPPRPTEPEEKQEDDQKETLDHPSVPATCSGVQVRRNTWTVWAHRLRSTSKAKGQRKKREA